MYDTGDSCISLSEKEILLWINETIKLIYD